LHIKKSRGNRPVWLLLCGEKRGMIGVYQHCGEQHLHRYLAEFDLRYVNRVRLGINDTARADRVLLGAKGKRLTYETTVQG
jgi:hypothetical protein